MSRIDSHSNGAGHSINRPKPSSRIDAASRSTFGSKSNSRVIAPSSSAVVENEMTKPSAIIAGRKCPARPIEAPSRIGSIGSVQGAAMVRTPARRAKMSSSMGYS
ncbi:hypothetical protein ACVWWP_008277 [Bradyrhizobium sp. LM3.6]